MPKLSLPKVAIPKVSVPGLKRADSDVVPADQPRAPEMEVHPRIERRRKAVGRSSLRRNWRRWTLLGIAILLSLVVAGLFSPFLDLDHLEVAGVEGDPSGAVAEATGLTTGTAMFGIRPGDVRARVESLPWVAHADVDAHWPDTVKVTVTAERPLAVLDDGTKGRGAILMSSGVVLSASAAGPLTAFAGGAPHISVDPGYDAAAARDASNVPGESSKVALAVLTQLRPVAAAGLQELHIDSKGNVTLTRTLPGSDAAAELSLGAPDDLPAKATALDSVLSGSVELACIDRVDVSVPTRVTIRRSEGCTIPTRSGG